MKQERVQKKMCACVRVRGARGNPSLISLDFSLGAEKPIAPEC
jgi:hypothetical protein